MLSLRCFRLGREPFFVLKATGDGWDTSVTGGTDANTDFVWVVTPPYRFDNPRYVGTGYGHSAADAVAWTPRGFSFVLDSTAYSTAADAVGKLLWPAGASDSQIRAAQRTLSQMPRADGLLRIKQAGLSATDGAGGARIESLAFEVEIHPPIDLREALRKKFLRVNPGYETVEEACPGAAAPIHIGKVLYHDFDGDGFEEAAILAYSCIAGTGGADLLGVFTRSGSGGVDELEIGGATSGDRKARENLRGKVDIKIAGGRLVEEFPIYRDEDPNCCPTGGIRKFVYRWNGKAFVPDKVEDVPAEANQ